MALEVYKFEIGTSLPAMKRLWRFYWEISNTSGHDQAVISGEIAEKLYDSNGWLSWFTKFWSEQNSCDLFRIRRVWPSIDPWNDFYYRFRHLKGFGSLRRGPDQSRVRCVWFSAAWDPHLHCSYFNSYGLYGIENNAVVGQLLQQLQFAASQHPLPQTTAAGDQFRPALLDKYGNYLPVIHGWADPRVYVTNRHHWKG